jgi:imidazole glycerol-phosphate synthase subunit HisF
MIRPRMIPVLLLDGSGLVKTIKFKDPKYIGDPINAVRIFNEKEVDELVLLDITRTRHERGIQLQQIRDIASEAFMPMGYGGGIRTMQDVYQIFQSGFEKVILNTAVLKNRDLIHEAVKEVGSQSIVISIDVRKDLLGRYETYVNSGKDRMRKRPEDLAREMEDSGAGEIILNSIDRDGTREGFDLALIHNVAQSVHIPLVACGGAGSIQHFVDALQSGASAVAAGSLFVLHGKHRAVLISYPQYAELKSTLEAHANRQ